MFLFVSCYKKFYHFFKLLSIGTLVEGYFSYACTLQRSQVSSRSESKPYVACQRTYVCSFAAYDPYFYRGQVAVEQLYFVYCE